MIHSKKSKNLIVSASIPFAVFLLAVAQHYLEYYFRFSGKNHFVYGYGSSFRFFIQLGLAFFGFIRGTGLLTGNRDYMNTRERIASGLISMSPALYILLALIIAFIDS
ncbi:MAG: hypothetical protein HYZ15_02960 [Sphingobacteriales bacterium]|nr:hypothetical protein [Sphingobacteriales bacterium]